MRWPGLIALLVPSIAIVAHCALEGFNQVETLPAGGAGGGIGGQGGSSVCEHALVPDPPDAQPEDGGTELVVALRQIYMSEAPDGGPIGYDLDKTCTCQGEGSSCNLPGNADGCDLPGGRDNSLTPMIVLLSATVGADLSTLYSNLAEQGNWGVLLRIRGYNGEADDEKVEVALFGSGGPAGLPAWDGNDEWTVSSASLQPAGTLEEPLYVDAFAYVTGGLLVSSLTNLELVFSGASGYLAIKMTGGFITGRLEPQGAGYALRDGIIAGRVGVADVFAAVSSFRFDGGALCTDNLTYNLPKVTLCNHRDLTVVSRAPTVPCDAISWALAFEAEPAKLGAIADAPVPGPGCPPATDPAYDSCD